MATLDAIRAVLKSTKIAGIAERHVTVNMWGYSGGLIPTEWAAELQLKYAPELDIAGAAVGSAIANLNNTVFTTNGTSSAGFGLAGLCFYQEFKTPELTKLFEDETFESNSSKLFQAGKQCAVKNTSQFDSQDIGKHFRSGLDFLSLSEVAELIQKSGVMGKRSLPTIPLYFYKSIVDEIDPVSSTDDLVEKYCSQNVNSLQHVRNDASSHVSQAFFGADGAVAFLNDRFDGVTPPEGLPH